MTPAILKDSMTKSFMSGLIARYLAQQARLPGAEEAFISGMCQNLGENLVIFYFADEFEDIVELRRLEGLDKAAAARGVLGVGFAEVGAAVAKTWNLPRSIIDAIRGVPPGALAVPLSDDEKIRDMAVFANELCDIFQHHERGDIDGALHALLARFEKSIVLEHAFFQKLIGAVFEKLKRFAPIFEINVARSNYCRAVHAWLDIPPVLEEPDAAIPKQASK